MRQLILGKVAKFLVEKLSVLQMCEDNEKIPYWASTLEVISQKPYGRGDTPRAFRVNT